MLLSCSHRFRLHRTMIFYDGHDGIDLASENVVTVIHCCSYSCSWGLFYLLQQVKINGKKTPYHPAIQTITQCGKCPCPDGLLGNYSERLSSSRKGRR